MSKLTLHLIANAHLDPVWLWDWREGLNEGITTCRTILNLMDERPEMTFVRGESAIYEHIERHDPETFARIAHYVASGRWDIVGGTYIQPDTNMPATETLTRHFTRGLSYFWETFGKRPVVAWAADSFGHTAGLPEILAAAGMTGITFTRPESPSTSPAFWWEGPGGTRVLAYRPMVGWYGTERDEVTRRLDALIAQAGKFEIQNIGAYYGVGNHGGGPTRRQLDDIAAWAAAHPDINVVHSGLHRLFESLVAEAAERGEKIFPTYRGELNYCLRGCYASVAKMKFLFRKCEGLVSRAETTSTVIRAGISHTTEEDPRVREAWEAVLFNSFHDILPGSSIERALEDQAAWLGTALHHGQRVELDAVNALAAHVDTTVPAAVGDGPTAQPFLLWNPHPFPFRGPVELEANLDYRPIWKYENRVADLPVEVRGPDSAPVPFQRVHTEHESMPNLPWRVRALVNADIPPFGWAVYDMGYREDAIAPEIVGPPVSVADGIVDNGLYRVEAGVGKPGIAVLKQDTSIFGNEGLSFVTVEDHYGSWGSMDEAPESQDLQDVRCKWTIEQVETLQAGKLRGTLWVRLTGGRSTLELTISLHAGRDAVDIAARLLWDDRSARVKMIMPVDGGEQAEFDVPGATVKRERNSGEVPGGRWVRVPASQGAFGFASDSLYNFNYKNGALQATIARGSRYAADTTIGMRDEVWTPAVDRGELKFRFLLTLGSADLQALARVLESPVIVQTVPASSGTLPRSGSFGSIKPDTLKLLAFKPADDGNGMIVRVQNATEHDIDAVCTLFGIDLPLGNVPSGHISSWRVARDGNGWTATAADSTA